jgi:hypothetical protein
MAIVKYLATWDGRETKARGLRQGEILLHAQPRYWKNLRKAFEKLHHKQQNRSRDDPTAYVMYDIEVELDVLYKKRTLDQNALMWSLYEIEAAEMNAGAVDLMHEVTPGRLYAQDMEGIAPTVSLVVQARMLPDLASLGMSWRRAVPVEGTDLVTAEIIRTSSKWTTVEMARHIQGQFNRLALSGVHLEKAADIGHYWVQFRQHVNDERIPLTDEKLTKDQYRALNPLCEGCGAFVGANMEHPSGGGHVHHILSRGAGGAEPELDWPANWLHLCPACHDVWNEKDGGVVEFIKVAPQCESKIRRALEGDPVVAGTEPEKGAEGGAEEGVADAEHGHPGDSIRTGGSAGGDEAGQAVQDEEVKGEEDEEGTEPELDLF